jgi:uncharacterized protein YjbI with pentapeptide repeats
MAEPKPPEKRDFKTAVEGAKALRSPAVVTAIGVVATVVLALMVVITLLRTGGAKAVSDNAALIGALVALGGVFTAQMVSIALEDRREQETRELEDRREQETRELEAQRTREAALQNYLEQVGKLLIEKPLRRASPGDNLSTVVRAQTLAVLEGLDPERKRILLLFLYESGLIYKHRPVVSLAAAKLTEVNLTEADLTEADLSETNLAEAVLSRAILSKADLSDATLSEAILNEANLSEANLSKAYLLGANLTGANLSRANLSEAYLWDANLNEAILSRANFQGANLSYAKKVTDEQLADTLSLQDVIMPNRSEHP